VIQTSPAETLPKGNSLQKSGDQSPSSMFAFAGFKLRNAALSVWTARRFIDVA
jgi:hypothetical protein